MSKRILILFILYYSLSVLQCSPVIQENIAIQDSQNELSSLNRRSKDIKIFSQRNENITEVLGSAKYEEGRTFGLRRLKIAIPLIMFKLGAMTTLLGFLTLIALKTLGIVIMLLVFKLSGFLAKFHLLKVGHIGHEHHIPSKEIHVHVHKDQGHFVHHEGHHEGPYHGWDKTDNTGPSNDVLTLNRLKYLNSLYQQAI